MIERSFFSTSSVRALCCLPCTKHTSHLLFSFKTTSSVYLCPHSGLVVRVRSHRPFFHLLLLSKQSVRTVSDTSCNPCLEWTPRRIGAPLVSTTRRSMHSPRFRRRERTLRRGKEYLVHAYQNMNSSISSRTALWLGTAKHKIQVVQDRAALTGECVPTWRTCPRFSGIWIPLRRGNHLNPPSATSGYD